MVNKHIAWLTAIGLVFVLGCGSGESGRDSRAAGAGLEFEVLAERLFAEDTASRHGDVAAACAEFVERGLIALGPSRAEIIAEVGEPDSIVSIPVPNEYAEGQVDTVFRVHFDGLTAFVKRVTDGPEYLSSVVVTKDSFLTDSEVRIGLEWEELVALLGEPTQVDADLFEYNCGTTIGPDEPVYVRMKDGRVVEIHFTYYTG